MSNTEAQNLSIAAAAKRLQAEALVKEAKELEYRAEALTSPKVKIRLENESLTLTQAQLHFIHTKAFGMDHGDVLVDFLLGTGNLLVTAGDERWSIDGGATVVQTEGFDPFDRQWGLK
ncbi:hypothetical protein SEA_PUREGLOBE5_86 [Arthrobacter phage Pureglobe5]|nr:hypothetical protein PBI_BEAGLE_88 [Arthrobacter phage Beagle]UYL87449.1 hypothetical protein SEA_PUREGLOBE5_86 [Arthrobacter phage Pureglobe5]